MTTETLNPKELALQEKLDARLAAFDATRFDQIISRAEGLEDILVDSRAVRFDPNEEIGGIDLKIDRQALPMTEHAFRGLSRLTGAPMKFVNELLDPETEGVEGDEMLAARILTREMESHNRTFLLRTESPGDGTYQVAAFLTDRYKRLDTPTLVRSFREFAEEAGGQMGRLHLSATRFSIEAYHPTALWSGDEAMAFGVSMRQSDFGDGKFELRSFVERIWCANLQAFASDIDVRHIGKPISGDRLVSQKTIELDTLTQLSEMRDVVFKQLHPDTARAHQSVIGEAMHDRITADDDKLVKRLPKLGLDEAEVAALIETLAVSDPEVVPQGPLTRFKLSQGVSHLANVTKRNGRRAMALQELSGDMLVGNAKLN